MLLLVKFMVCSRPSKAVPDDAVALAARLGLILAGLAAVVARRFLKEPQFAGLIVPLWGWLGRVGRRFAVAVARAPVVRAEAARQPVARLPVAGVPVSGLPVARLPSGHGWLVKALGWEAAGYGCQLEALLAEPGMQVAWAGLPAVRRILRPFCQILGVVTEEARLAAAAALVRRQARVAAKAVPKPRVRRMWSDWERPDPGRWERAARASLRKYPEPRLERPPRAKGG